MSMNNIYFLIVTKHGRIFYEHEYTERIPKHWTSKTLNVNQWNSKLYMIDRAMSLWEEINDVLKIIVILLIYYVQRSHMV